MWLLTACLSCFITQCSLARGHFFMSDLYIPLPGSNSRNVVHPGNLDSRRSSRNEHLRQKQSHTQGQKVSHDIGIPVVITRGVTSGLSQKAGVFRSGLFFHLGESSAFWTHIFTSVDKAFPLDDPRGPYTSDFRVCSQYFQAFNTIQHLGIWKQKSMFPTKTAPKQKRN